MSLRLARACARALRGDPRVPRRLIEDLDALDPELRAPVGAMLKLLAAAVELTGDEAIGLRMGHGFELKDYDAVGYVVASSNTVREAIEAAIEHIRLLDDAARFALEVCGERAYVWLYGSLPYPRVAADARAAAMFTAATRFAGITPSVETEVWFEHPAPERLQPYREVFGEVSLRFGAKAHAFVFPACMLERPLHSADPQLHRITRSYVRGILDRLPTSDSVSARAITHLRDALLAGGSSAKSLAAALHMSKRTLARRLEDESTSYNLLFDEVRRGLALELVEGTRLGTCEIAYRIGFSHPAPFVRAFRRWTGTTPQRYRRRHRGAA